jgi:hypothetical protein
MHIVNLAASCLVLALALTAIAGGESFALAGRPPREQGQDKFVPEVERLDASYRELHLRPNDSRIRVVGCPADARGIDCQREYSATELEAADMVAMQAKQDSRGNSYAYLIHVQERTKDRNQGRDSITRPGLGIRTVDGKVEQVDRQRNSFEIRNQSGEKILVFLPYDTRRPEVDRFQTLRAGDYVRVEGRFLDRERFELENFV